jgi:hypothetical protein
MPRRPEMVSPAPTAAGESATERVKNSALPGQVEALADRVDERRRGEQAHGALAWQDRGHSLHLSRSAPATELGLVAAPAELGPRA